ncbi:hypothetical protein Pla52n_43450 [Stieleria varia]|uniref:Uncharacterized protein n=1 Tax=Stieleria varia TaxID=2528005 RepID=A0A5C6ALT2_9BACT|nr:hypothetical protein Pla52n_43450 [Stieleria varia]
MDGARVVEVNERNEAARNHLDAFRAFFCVASENDHSDPLPLRRQHASLFSYNRSCADENNS